LLQALPERTVQKGTLRFSDELRRDLSSLRRYLWLILLLLLLALGSAAASLLLVPSSNEASFRSGVALSSLPPLFGPETLPAMDDFARLSLSEEALEEASQALREQDVDVSAEALKANLSAHARENENAIDFRVTFDDSDRSLAVARAWSEVFAELAPARAPDLEQEAAASYQRQLDRARTELEEKRQQLADLGVASGAGGERVNPTQAAYEAKAAALAEKEVERTELANLIETLRASTPGSLSADQLRLLLAGVLPPEAALEAGFTAQQAIGALELRALSLDSTILALRQEVQGLGSALDQSATEVREAVAELEAAEENYEVASRLAQSYEVVGDLLSVEVFTLQEPHLVEAGVLSYVSRFAAAAAFALVAGVLGAFGLEWLRARGSGRPSARQANAVATRVSDNPVRNEAPRLRSHVARRPRYRTSANAYLQFGASALAVLLLLGILGTLSLRRNLRHRPH
jgi:hypothetical protein